MNRRHRNPVRWSMILLAAVGCADWTECDDGQVLNGAVCVPAPANGDAGQAGSAGVAGQAGGSGSAGGDGGQQCSVEFGTPCSDSVNHSDCGCPADFCGIAPGATTGYCTTTGCKEDPSLCPSGWTCVDFSVYDPSFPSACVPPS